MHEVQLRDAKATLSAVVDQARRGEPSIITRHGRPEAVVLSYEDWQRSSQVPSFGRLLTTARRIGILADHARGQGRDPGLADLATAATAMVRSYVVLTCNLRHFAPLGAPVHDPFEALPADVRL